MSNKSLLFTALHCCAMAATSNIAFAQAWIRTSAPVDGWTAVVSSADGAKLVAAAGGSSSSGLIYISTNSGNTWAPTLAPSKHWGAVASSADGTILVATVGLGLHQVNFYGAIYTSTNSGVTWTSNNVPLVNWLAVTCSTDGRRLAALAAPSILTSYILTSTNSGVTWSTNNAPDSHGACLAASANGAKLIFSGFPGYIWGSTNPAGPWTKINTSFQYWGYVASLSGGTGVMAARAGTGVNGPIYTSPDWGGTWISNSIPLSGWSSIAASVDGTRLAAAAGNGSTQPYYGLLYTSFDSGLTWTKATAPKGDWYGIASSVDGSKLVAVMLADGIYVWRSVPSLGISSVNTNLVLYWPSNASASRFVLQANEDLNTTNWTDALTGPTVSNQQYQVVTPLSASNIFYRLISR